jgi:hypothetical protein
VLLLFGGGNMFYNKEVCNAEMTKELKGVLRF